MLGRFVCRQVGSKIMRSLRPSVSLNTPQISLLASNRFFSTETDKAKRRLEKILSSELRHEQESEEKDDSIDQFLNEKGWNLIESDDSNVIEMKKSIANCLISVFFIARNPPMDEPQEEMPEEAQSQEEGEESGSKNWDDYIDFSVIVNNNSGKYLIAECSSAEGQVQVSYVNICTDPMTYKNANPFNNTTNSYKGPDFNTLDDRLSESMYDYLRSLGIDEELATFIEHVSLDKEQDLYVKWLKDVKDFM